MGLGRGHHKIPQVWEKKSQGRGPKISEVLSPLLTQDWLHGS